MPETEQPMLMSKPKKPQSSTRRAAGTICSGVAPATWQTRRDSSASRQRKTGETRGLSVGTLLAPHISVNISPHPPYPSSTSR